MALTATIQLTQGPNTDIPGNAVIGTLTDGAVTCASTTNTGVEGWDWELIDVPPGSAIPIGHLSVSSVASFPQPDVRGGYLVQLTVSDGAGHSDTTLLTLQVIEQSGRIIPPFKAPGTALTFGGQQRGWSPTMESWLRHVDTIPVFPKTTTASFVQPSIGVDVSVQVDSTSGIVVNSAVFVSGGGGYYSVTSITDSTHLVLNNLGNAVNAPPTTTIAGGSNIAASGHPGAPGTNGTNGTGRSAVRAVQTAALPANTYNSGAKTITFTANGPLASTIFDGIVPLSTDTVKRYLVNSVGAAATINGIYDCTQTGVLGVSPCILTRSTDLDSTADFVGGVQFDVIDGTSGISNNAGTRWGMTTLTAVTLDTTQTTWAVLGKAQAAYIDLSKSPYNMRDNPGGDNIDQGLQLVRFSADAHALSVARANTPVYGILPPGRMMHDGLVDFQTGTGLIGVSAPEDTVLFSKFHGAGEKLIAGTTRIPDIYSTAIDTRTSGGLVNTPWYSYDPSSTFDPWLNLRVAYGLYLWIAATPFSGFPETGLPALDITFNFQCDSLTGRGWHFASCRGKQVGGDPLDTTLYISTGVSGNVQGILKLTDLTTGVYGAITYVNQGTSAFTGDGTITPTDDTDVWLYFPVGGTVGVAGIKYITSDNGGRTWSATPATATALGTATSISIGAPDSPFFAAKFNLGAGTINAGQYVKCTTSGTRNSYTLNLPNGTVVVVQKHELDFQYDSGTGTIRLSCSKFGDTSSTTVTTTGHGLILQKPHESLVFGNAMNNGDEQADFPPAAIAIGAIRVTKGSVTAPPATCRTTIPTASTTDQLAFVCFGIDPYRSGVSNAITRYDGTTIIAWYGNRQGDWAAWGKCNVYPRRTSPGTYPTFMRFENFTVATNAGGAGHGAVGSGMLVLQNTQSRIGPLNFKCGGDSMRVVGPNFYTEFKPCNCNGGLISLANIDGGMTMSGTWVIQDSLILVHSQQGGFDHHGEMALNPGQLNRECMNLDGSFDGDTIFRFLSIDGEELAGAPRSKAMIRAYTQAGKRCTIGGFIEALQCVPISYRGGADGYLDLNTYPCNIVTYRSCVVDYAGTATTPTKFNANTTIGNSVSTPGTPLCNVAGKAYWSGGRAPNGSDLGDSSVTISALRSGASRYKMPDATTTANRTLTLSPANMSEGDCFEVTLGVQGNNVIFANGGLTGGTLKTALAGFSGTLVFQAQGGQLGLNLVWI